MNKQGIVNHNKKLRLELSHELVSKLVSNGCLHIADFKCLDFDSKKEICRIFLDSALHTCTS